jgi:LmbE family N-acetylglucosaminyl deacetylase
MDKLHCLGLDESETINLAKWPEPTLAPEGLTIAQEKPGEIYRKNFQQLTEKLDSLLSGYDNVFTHNPWGEYGHEEHVQVFRAVEKLGQKTGFNLWVSNYASNKSLALMNATQAGISGTYISSKTDTVTAKAIRDIYRRNGCWTWYEDYTWFDSECMLLVGTDQGNTPTHGHRFPMNLLNIHIPPRRKQGKLQRLLNLMRPRNDG